MKKKTIPEGKVECEACNGTGECCYSCCTGEIVRDDIQICPKCHEHLGDEICQSCDGVGYVDEDSDNCPDIAPSLQAKAEMVADIAKGH